MNPFAPTFPPSTRARAWLIGAGVATLSLSACMSPNPLPTAATPDMPQSQWQAVSWADLPALQQDDLNAAWHAWLASCQRQNPVWLTTCRQVRNLSLADNAQKLQWMQSALQPYRIVPRTSNDTAGANGLLTSYYEPEFFASRLPQGRFTIPLYQAPANLATRKPWYSRQEIDTLPVAQASLRGREIAYLADPIDAVILHIQGSGRLQVQEPNGQTRQIRVAYAATNDQPYQSIGRYLLNNKQTQNVTWPGIKQWVTNNPNRLQELLWSNPRYVFFKEESLDDYSTHLGPKGAQGVPLTPERSIAVDPKSIPYGTPVWLSTQGATLNTNRLVIAQDTGGAIRGAVRADYYMGTGAAAGDVAGRVRQPLQLWALWPK